MHAFKFLICLGLCFFQQVAFADDDLFTEVNAKFRKAYGEARDAEIIKNRPIIVTNTETITLFRDGPSLSKEAREDVHLDLELFHQLKTVSHIPLTIFLLYDKWTHYDSSVRNSEEFRSYKEVVLKTKEAVKLIKVQPGMFETQMRIIDQSLELIDQILRSSNVSKQEVDGFIQSVKPDIDKNISWSVSALIEKLEEVICGWKKVLTKNEWNNLHVVILGSFQAKNESIYTQYFEKMLNVKNNRSRVVYLDHTTSVEEALKSLGVILLDREISDQFFRGNKTRMEKDLLSEEAKKQLK